MASTTTRPTACRGGARTRLHDHHANAEGVQLTPQRLRHQVERRFASAVGALCERHAPSAAEAHTLC